MTKVLSAAAFATALSVAAIGATTSAEAFPNIFSKGAPAEEYR